jgi:hypothetical protein
MPHRHKNPTKQSRIPAKRLVKSADRVTWNLLLGTFRIAFSAEKVSMILAFPSELLSLVMN